MNATNLCPECGKPIPPNALQGLCPECMMKVGVAPPTGGLGPGGTKVDPRPPEPAPLPADIARLFPQLEILECLGSGGMGAVYKARQPRLDRVVALKVLRRDRVEETKEAHFTERFEREARALARLNHPHIVTMYEFGQVEGLPYFIMEYVDGVNLRQLERSARLEPHQALGIIPQICEALQFAHEEGVVHRDIKPENILVDRKGRVKIADFGIAKLVGRESNQPAITETRQAIGTPHYMAPEQVEKPQTVDHRADIYSLGVVLYEMLTGELPLGKFPPPSRKVHVDVRLDEVVLHALEKEPERRYQHAHEVKTDVETIAGSELQAPPAPGASGPALEAHTVRSPYVRIVEIASDTTFTSPVALRLVNLSALGFLGALAFLGFVPLRGWEGCFGFSGFAGFFGLIGAAFFVERNARRNRNTPPSGDIGAGTKPGAAQDPRADGGATGPKGRTLGLPQSTLFAAVAVGLWLVLTAWGNATAMLVGSALAVVVGLAVFGRRTFRGGLLIAVAALGVATAVIILLNTTRPARRQPPGVTTNREMTGAGPVLPTGSIAAGEPRIFGEVTERVLPASAPCRMHFLQFRTGDVISIGDGPGDNSDHTEDYDRAEQTGGLDLSAIGGAEGFQVVGRGCVFTRDRSPDWDTLTADEAVRTLQYESWLNGVVEVPRKDFPATYLFKTAQGDRGILQILGAADDQLGWNSQGVQLRYRLVRASPATGTPAH